MIGVANLGLPEHEYTFGSERRIWPWKVASVREADNSETCLKAPE